MFILQQGLAWGCWQFMCKSMILFLLLLFVVSFYGVFVRSIGVYLPVLCAVVQTASKLNWTKLNLHRVKIINARARGTRWRSLYKRMSLNRVNQRESSHNNQFLISCWVPQINLCSKRNSDGGIWKWWVGLILPFKNEVEVMFLKSL